MAIGILLVDDSAVIRGILSKELSKNAEIQILDTASDGQMAVSMARQHQPSIVMLDLEMPIMDGLTAIPKILEASPRSKIIVLSSLSRSNGRVVFDALGKGAVDFVVKPERDEKESFYVELLQKIQFIARGNMPVVRSCPIDGQLKMQKSMAAGFNKKYRAIAIGSSTGGPSALLELFRSLKGKIFSCPIFITQHMQPTFTPVFAQQITQASGMLCHEAKDGEIIKDGRIYLAPGDAHMLVKNQGGSMAIHLSHGLPVNSCRPSVDPMFASLANFYGQAVLGVVLTGMGSDGAQGAQTLVQHGATIIAQDQQTSVVYGMPKAVAEMGICEEILPLQGIAEYLKKLV